VSRIEISDFIEHDELGLKGIVIHEMIHVYLLINGEYKNREYSAHGLEFLKKRREIKGLIDFDIPITDDITNKLVSHGAKLKPVDFLLFSNKDRSSFSVLVFKKDFLKDKKDEVYEIYKNMLVAMPDTTIYAFQSDNIQLLKYPAKNKFTRSMPAYRLDSYLADKFSKEAKLLYVVKEV
jgi:hypothetical protein